MTAPARSVTFAELIRQGALAVGDGYRAKLQELGGSGPLFLRAGALSERGFDWSGLDTFDAGVKVDGKMGVPDDVVVTTKGNSIGRLGYVPDGSPAFVYSPHLSYWRSLDRQELEPRYLYAWARSETFRSQLRALAFGTDMAPYFSLRDQMQLRVALPPIAEQRAIAEVLGALDDKIAAITKLARTADDLCIALCAQATRRLPLNAACRQLKASRDPQGIAAERVTHFSLPAFDDGKRPELIAPSNIKSLKFILEQPSVLISKLNPRFPRVWDIPELPAEPALCSTEFLVLEPDICSTSTLAALLSQPDFSSSLQGKARGTSGSHQRVRPDDLLATEIGDPQSLPERTDQRVTALGCRAMRAREESANLAAMRNTLLPHLMSGRLRVKDAEAVL